MRPNETMPDATVAQALVRIFAAWQLTGDVSAGLWGVPEPNWNRIRSGTWSGQLSEDQALRASALVGLYKALHLYFGDELADDWVLLDNRGPLFRGRSPVDFMQAGGLSAMTATRAYVDALRGGI